MNTVLQGFRVSPQQARLRALGQSAPELSLGVACTLRMRGVLDRAALGEAVARVAGRHEILRTGFRTAAGNGILVQVVGDATAELEFRDLGDELPELERAVFEAAAWQSGAGCRTGEEAVPLRAVLFRRGEDDHVLQLALPALCADPSTLDVLVQEIGAAYAELTGADAESTSAEPFQYVDYSEWLLETLESDAAGEGRVFWRRQGLVEDAPLPDLWPVSTSTGAYGMASEQRTWDAAFARRVDKAASASGTTMEAWLLAALRVLLRRYAGDEGYAVGVASDGRVFEEMQGGMGPFTRYIPLRGDVADAEPFAVLAAATGEALRQARAWQMFHTWPAANGHGEPHLCFGFDFAELPPQDGRWGGVEWRVERRWHQTDRIDVRLSAEREAGEGALRIVLSADARALPAVGLARLARRFGVLLEATLAAPATRVDSLSRLDAGERTEALGLASGAPAVFAVGEPLHRLFEQPAARTSDTAAVTVGASA